MVRLGRYPMLAFLLVGCAQVSELGGGPKDTEAPRLVRSIPEQGGTDFDGARIFLEFDERIQLDRVRDRLLVSPPLTKAPTVRPVGPRALEIELNAPLAADRTYTFSIGEAVKDLTEGNQALGLDLVFATGPSLDSLIIAGTVEQAFSGKAEKGALVMAYETIDDTSFQRGRPLYATRTDAEGRYLLQHLRPGNYTVHALVDQNMNYAYDLPNESIAFLSGPVEAATADSNSVEQLLRLFLEPSKEQRIVDHRVEADGALRITLAQPGLDATVRDIARVGGRLTWSPAWSPGRDTLTLWPSDTTALRDGRYEVSLGGTPYDTISYRPALRMPFHTKLALSVDEQFDGARYGLVASRPLRTIDLDRIRLMVDSSAMPLQMELDSLDPQRVLLDLALPPGKKATIDLLPKAVTDIYGGNNDTLRIEVERPDDKATGTLRVELLGSGATGQLVIQLMNTSGAIVRSEVLTGDHSVTWERLTPGIHGLRCIADTNGNGRWDTGELASKRPPERVWTNAEPVNVRAGWDLNVDWVLP